MEELRSALVRAEELGMAKADLVVVAAGTELLQRFPVKSNWDSRSSAFGSSGDDMTISEDEVLALSVLDLCAELGEGKDCDGELRDDLGASDASSDTHANMMQSLKKLDLEDDFCFDGGTSSSTDSNSNPVSVCDIIDSNDMSVTSNVLQ